MNYYFDNDDFVINNYNKQSPFSSFLPGLAGKKGIPLWAFYVNRAQGISSFGIHNKNHPILEFSPANKAYASVGQSGFRTFIKIDNDIYEPFNVNTKYEHKMVVRRSEFFIEEINPDLGIKITVSYFGLPNEMLGAIVRNVKIENISKKKTKFEMLDGISEILPYGVTNQDFKSVSNLLTSWFVSNNYDYDFAFYTLRSSTSDSAEVTKVSKGNFLMATDGKKLIKPIVDPSKVFGYDNSKTLPINFISKSLKEIQKQKDVHVNQIGCGFIPVEKTLNPGEVYELNMLSGNTHDIKYFDSLSKTLLDGKHLQNKRNESKELIDELVQDVKTSSNNKVFDEYVKQNYLDNLMRGGYPTQFGKHVFHLYARRHGDLERDYNFFSLAPEFYSTGDGNFRDVCQNRRLDSYIQPFIEDFNIKHFFSLVQLDGYNPLVVKPMMYELNRTKKDTLVQKHFESNEALNEFLKYKFTPGGLVNFVESEKVKVITSEEEYLTEIMNHSEELIESSFGEGYWSDHFDYLYDLLEDYLSIYPDKLNETLFDTKTYKTFSSPVSVIKQHDKSVLTKEGTIRQYGSLLHHDDEKINRLGLQIHESNWEKVNGEIYKTNLYTKMLMLVLNKHSLMDQDFYGVEMDGGKPGWNDAMNGVPGLFGSGVSEAVETLRIAKFLKGKSDGDSLELPIELADLLYQMLEEQSYEQRLAARDMYRDRTRFGFSGVFTEVSFKDLLLYFDILDIKITDKINELFEVNKGVIPTFIVHEVTKYDEIKLNGEAVIGNYNLPIVKPHEFKTRFLPNFLEAPARLLKSGFDQDKCKKMYEEIKKSGMYDKQLKIYKTSNSLEEESIEIGRIRAFTQGWLERESDFLHMTYKYLLGLIKAGLYKEFYEEIDSNMVCFMEPEVYKRSTLENSSFIVPTNNPNETSHGKGFFARLSGSTIETLDMWKQMMTGGNPFKMKGNELVLEFEPKLHGDFFKDDGTLSFTFMKKTTVTYINPNKEHTYTGMKAKYYELIENGNKIKVNGEYLSSKYALKVREGYYNEIKVFY